MKLIRGFVWLALVSLPLLEAASQETGPRTLQGRLLERGTRKALEGVNVFVLPAKLRATTDAKGRFEIRGEIPDEFTWVINASGYNRLERDSSFPGGDSATFELYLEKTSYQVFETTVVGKEARRDDSKKTLKASEFINLPGSGGDPVKAVQNLPGVNRPAPFQSQVIIQGSAPKDTSYLIDGHEVPIIFHFGGLSSVVTPEALERVDYLSAAYGPENGRALGGLVGVWTKSPRKDRLGGFGFIDTFNSGFMLEGPAGENSSFLLSARQSYIGAVLRQALGNNEDFNLTVAPAYRDFTGIYETEIDAKNSAKLVAVASQDRLEFLLKQPVDQDPAFRGKFESETSFFRLIPQWTHRHGEGLTSRWSLGLGKDWITFDAGENYFFLQSVNVTARAELEKRFSPLWTAQWGLDHTYASYSVDLSFADTYREGGVANPFSSGQRAYRNVKGDSTQLGAYWRNELKPSSDSRWTFLPSARGDYFGSTEEFFVGPRLGSRYALNESFTLKAGAGYYVQPPEPQEIDSVVGNPDLRAPKAVHGMLGFEKDFRGGTSDGFVWSGGGFYRQFYDLVTQSSRYIYRNGSIKPENNTNEGRGRAYGAETLLKLQHSDWTGWVSYTLSRSVRWNRASATQEYPFQYDQTHLATAILARELPSNWRVSTRFRYATGNPNTPITGAIFDADNDVYVPVRGVTYSERLEPFYQLDFRIDKKWILNKWILSAYLDIQNLTNRENLEAVRYNYDYSQKTQVSGLPILPTFGVKGEF